MLVAENKASYLNCANPRHILLVETILGHNLCPCENQNGSLMLYKIYSDNVLLVLTWLGLVPFWFYMGDIYWEDLSCRVAGSSCEHQKIGHKFVLGSVENHIIYFARSIALVASITRCSWNVMKIWCTRHECVSIVQYRGGSRFFFLDGGHYHFELTSPPPPPPPPKKKGPHLKWETSLPGWTNKKLKK